MPKDYFRKYAEEIEKIADEFGLPDYIVDDAKKIFKKMDSSGKLKFRKKGLMVKASVIIALRKKGLPIPRRLIYPVSHLGFLHETIRKLPELGYGSEIDLKWLIERAAESLGLPDEVKDTAAKILPEMKRRHAAVSPSVLAAASLSEAISKHSYVGATRTAIADVLGVSTPAVRKAVFRFRTGSEKTRGRGSDNGKHKGGNNLYGREEEKGTVLS